ncbi:Hypothetical Protein RRSL_00180 [Ralstonia solanacearum UW551]|uniref:Uncharacterized protein n=1 Tax=Ralstonia solanacearum (strain UW551) TaxID=342110 RepID=A0AB33V7F8_RALSU|nr:Hypothetical Protein RRSL_00180 [Ralstonia solanacearum UW551]
MSERWHSQGYHFIPRANRTSGQPDIVSQIRIPRRRTPASQATIQPPASPTRQKPARRRPPEPSADGATLAHAALPRNRATVRRRLWPRGGGARLDSPFTPHA